MEKHNRQFKTNGAKAKAKKKNYYYQINVLKITNEQKYSPPSS